MIYFLVEYLPLLAVTMVVEAAIAWWWAPARLRRRCVAVSVCLNLLTHPLATLALLELAVPHLLLEAIVMGVEYVGYREVAGLRVRHALGLAVIANLITALLAFVWMSVVG